MTRALPFPLFAIAALCLPALLPLPAAAQAGAVYRCPGPPVLYTDALTPEEARDRGCRTIEGAPITIVQTVRPRPPASAGAVNGAAASGAPARATPRSTPAPSASVTPTPAASSRPSSDARKNAWPA